VNAIGEITQADELASTVSRWLDQFEKSLTAGNAVELASLFTDESHWRDVLAFTWSITPVPGRHNLARALIEAQQDSKAQNFALSPVRHVPRRVSRLGIDCIEAFIQFDTHIGLGNGCIRLVNEASSDVVKAWVLLTTLEELKGFEENTGSRRPTGEAYSRNFGGENWLDQRQREQRYDDREPAVLVIGGGQAGLAIAARLGRLNVDTLVIDKLDRIGDCWRKRYHSLALHNQIQVNHLPYMPFPESWPVYIPKDMLANWFESYVDAMEINFWTGTEFIHGQYDDASATWVATVRKTDGSERTLRPRHIIYANGVSGIPVIPEFDGLSEFNGTVMHAQEFTDGSAWSGKNALVLGTGNSGHDICQDLHSHGAETTIVQRGSTTVVTIEPSARLNYALYDEPPSLEDCDMIVMATTYPLLVKGYQLAVKKTGHQMKYRTRGGGYYLDAGCSQLIVDGEIKLLQFDEIKKFCAEGARLNNGSVVNADLIVLATGYYPPQELVRRLMGDEIADRVGPIWGMDNVHGDGEMLNLWKRTAQPGLWFHAGSLQQNRIYSKYLALQIKAIEEGLLAAHP